MTQVQVSAPTSHPTGPPHRDLTVASHDRFPLLDGYRAIAACAVVVTHVGFQSGVIGRAPWGGPVARLDYGVTLFFLLSGFLLFRPHAVAHLTRTSGPRVVPYLWRRALRIFPAYWVVAAAALLLLADNRGLRPLDWLVQATLSQTFVHDGLVAGLTQMWSLGTEITFYLFLPLLGAGVRRLPGRTPAARLTAQLAVLVGLIALALAWRVGAHHAAGPKALGLYWLPAYIDWFALGMILASVHAWRSTTPTAFHSLGSRLLDLARSPGSCWAIGLSAFWMSTTRVFGPYDLSAPTLGQALGKHLLYAIAAFFMLLPGVLGPQYTGTPARLLGSRVMRHLGLVSYGIFLWNMLVLQLVSAATGQILFGGNFWKLLVLTFGVTVAIANISWYLVESRALRLKRLVPDH